MVERVRVRLKSRASMGWWYYCLGGVGVRAEQEWFEEKYQVDGYGDLVPVVTAQSV